MISNYRWAPNNYTSIDEFPLQFSYNCVQPRTRMRSVARGSRGRDETTMDTEMNKLYLQTNGGRRGCALLVVRKIY